MKIIKSKKREIYNHLLEQMRIRLLDMVASGEIKQEALTAWYAKHRREISK